MTETDATRRPLTMPPRFIPYLDKYRIYRLFKDMVKDLVITLPKDHLKHMKIYLTRRIHGSKDPDRVIILVSPDLTVDIKALVKELIKDLGVFVITRRCIIDRYEKHDDYVPGCISPVLMSQVTKNLTLKDPVPQAGWLMFDHPCTVREARCLQQDGILPTTTVVLVPPQPAALPAHDTLTAPRAFFQQDFEGLKFAYKATLKEVIIENEDDPEKIALKCFNAIRACASGLQGPLQGHHVVGAPGVYRVLLIGPRGSGRRTQATLLAKHFGLVNLHIDSLLGEAKERNDEIGIHLRKFGASTKHKADIVARRILQKDCIDHGWILTGYPNSGADFEHMDNMDTPANRIIFLNVDWDTCRARAQSLFGVDWCTGKSAALGSGPRVVPRADDDLQQLDNELDYYFTEALIEMRAAAGITAVEVDSRGPLDHIQMKLQAAVFSAPAFDIESCATMRNVRGD